MVEIKFIQVEFHFRFRNIIIVPKTIEVWYSLGMQSLLIPDSSFRLIGDQMAEEGDMNKCLHNDQSECIHARLHHNGKKLPLFSLLASLLSMNYSLLLSAGLNYDYLILIRRKP